MTVEYYVAEIKEAKKFIKEKNLKCKIWSRYPNYYDILEKLYPEARQMNNLQIKRFLFAKRREVELHADEQFSVIIKDAEEAAEALERFLEEAFNEYPIAVYVLEVYPYIENKAWKIKKKPRGRKGKPYYFVKRTTKIIGIENAGILLAVDKKYASVFLEVFPTLVSTYARYRYLD